VLNVGEQVKVPVAARPGWNDTGVDVVEGQELDFVSTGIWWDFFVPCGPGGHPSPSWHLLLRLVGPLRRAPTENWFALIGAVGPADQFLIGTGRRQRMPATGRLRCYANDVRRFYWNNWGSIQLTITRIT
jgi:hypothetical protein